MSTKEFEKLVKKYEDRKRKGSEDSDCEIVNKMWRIYWVNQDNDLGCIIAKWLLKRISNDDTHKVVKGRVYGHFFLNRHGIPKKHRKLFQAKLRDISKKKRRKIRRASKKLASR